MKNKTAASPLPTWDLSFLGKGAPSKVIPTQLQAALKKAKGFNRKYKGKIPGSASAFLKTIQAYEAILEDIERPQCFAYLRFSETSVDQTRGNDLQLSNEIGTSARKELLFFELELPAVLRKNPGLLKDRRLARVSHYLRKVLVASEHRLPEREEAIVADLSLTGSSAWSRLFDEEWGAQQFQFQKQSLSETEVLHLLYSPQRSVRAKAAASMTAGLQSQSRRMLYIFNTILAEKRTEDRMRNFPTPESARHLSNDTTAAAVDALQSAVEKGFPLVKRFYTLKKKLLKVSTLYDYDRYAPLSNSSRSIPWKTATTLVIDSFSDVDPRFGAIAQEFFDRKWIDAANRPGKRSGAYCSFVTADTHPLVFINYQGSLRDVFTLAHEVGHGLHAYLMRKNGFLNFDVPLTVAETASVFAEMALFQRLKSTLPESALLSMYVAKVESVFATVFRQISMYKFERLFHQARAYGEVSLAQANSFWRETQTAMFGKSVVLTPGYDLWWGYIPHFIHSPFYVYAYAFGELLTLSLFAQYQAERQSFVPKYFNLLSAGASASPETLMKPFGISLASEKFWGSGIKLIESLVDETEQLAV